MGRFGVHKVTACVVSCVTVPPFVPTPRRRFAARVAGATAVLVLAGVSTAAAAQPGATLRKQAHALDTSAHRALFDLYSIDARLQEARARLAALNVQAAQLRDEQVQLERRLVATRHTLAISQQHLGDNLSTLYKQHGVSTLAVVLGSESLDDAVTRLDDLAHVADESRAYVAASVDARARLETLRSELQQRRASLHHSLVDARRNATALAGARSARVAFVARLRRERTLALAGIRQVERQAARAARRSAELQTAAVATAPAPEPEAAAAAPVPVPTRAPAGPTLTVTTTGYSIGGHTATGMPVGWGVVAVDPTVIPLGTRLTIPGYGEAVAADTGGAIQGTTIDLWFPTLAQARAWGRRTVTVTLH